MIYNMNISEEIINIARAYATKFGANTIREAGVQKGFYYFTVFNDYTIDKYTGLPHIIKISRTGRISVVNNLREKMWAMEQEVALLKKSVPLD